MTSRTLDGLNNCLKVLMFPVVVMVDIVVGEVVVGGCGGISGFGCSIRKAYFEYTSKIISEGVMVMIKVVAFQWWH